MYVVSSSPEVDCRWTVCSEDHLVCMSVVQWDWPNPDLFLKRMFLLRGKRQKLQNSALFSERVLTQASSKYASCKCEDKAYLRRWEFKPYLTSDVIVLCVGFFFSVICLCPVQTVQVLMEWLQQLELICPDRRPVLPSLLFQYILILEVIVSLALNASETPSPSSDKYCRLLPVGARHCQDIARLLADTKTSAFRLFEPGGARDKRQECNCQGGMCFAPINGSLLLKEKYCRGGDDFQLPLLPPDWGLFETGRQSARWDISQPRLHAAVRTARALCSGRCTQSSFTSSNDFDC